MSEIKVKKDAPAAKPSGALVKALKRGYFQGRIIEAGEKFRIQKLSELGKTWMEVQDEKELEALKKLEAAKAKEDAKKADDLV